MKKKSSILLCALICLLMFSGCTCTGTAIVRVETDTFAPWKLPTLYERSEYSVEKYLMKESDKVFVKDTLLGKGSLTFLLTKGEKPDGGDCTKIEMTFKMKFEDIAEAGADRAKEDTITSSVLFGTMGLDPYLSTRVTDYADRVKDGKTVLNESCEITTDYVLGTSKRVWTKRSSAEESNRAISTYDQIFDNEQLFYAVRAFKNLALGKSQTFSLMNSFEAHLSKKATPIPMTVSVEANLVEKVLSGWKSNLNFGMTLTDEGTPKVDCMSASLAKSDTQPGTPIKVYYSSVPFSISENRKTYKVMTGIETDELLKNGRYRTFFNLIDYAAEAPKE